MLLNQLKAPKGAHKRKKLLGRGSSSGHGKTSTRGSKGQTSRAGRDFWLGFEGGQLPFIRRFPKRGFRSKKKNTFQIANLKDIEAKFKETTLVDTKALQEKGLIHYLNRPVKILGEGDLSKPLNIKADAFSKQAKEKINKAGGKIEIVSTRIGRDNIGKDNKEVATSK